MPDLRKYFKLKNYLFHLNIFDLKSYLTDRCLIVTHNIGTNTLLALYF